MRAVIQRVREASVTVHHPDGGSEVAGTIGPGLCVLLGVTHTDTGPIARKMADKLARLRVFPDADDKMNRSVIDADGEILVVSQFTLYGDARKGNRPSFVDAARPDVAEPLVGEVVEQLSGHGITVATGRFRTDMEVALVNWGPVTVVLDVD